MHDVTLDVAVDVWLGQVGRHVGCRRARGRRWLARMVMWMSYDMDANQVVLAAVLILLTLISMKRSV